MIGQDAVNTAMAFDEGVNFTGVEIKAGDHLVLSNVCYAGVSEYAHHALPRAGIEPLPARITLEDIMKLGGGFFLWTVITVLFFKFVARSDGVRRRRPAEFARSG